MTHAALDILIARVKAEAAARAGAADDAGLHGDAEADAPGNPALFSSAGAATLDIPAEAGIDGLLVSDTSAFVDTAYRLLLQREPDETGRANYVGELARGGSRLILAAKLRLSGEGRGVGVPLTGLRLAVCVAAADSALRRIGLGALGAFAARSLDTWAARRVISRTLVAWRRRFERIAGMTQRHERKLAELSRRVDNLQQIATLAAPVAAEVIDAYYLAFEDANRGSRESVLAKLAIYDTWLSTCVPRGGDLTHEIVDVGCGRGEWLSYMAQRGYAALGIDVNRVMIDACLARGHAVRCIDALTFLRSLPTGSVAAVTGFHIIEHLPFDYLFGLVKESYRVLVDGGAVLFETPNPENVLVGSHTFYHDFTHRNPITPTAISFLLKYHGFDAIDIIRSSPYPEEAKVPGNDPLTERVNGHLCGPQDFAVTGRKTGATGAHA